MYKIKFNNCEVVEFEARRYTRNLCFLAGETLIKTPEGECFRHVWGSNSLNPGEPYITSISSEKFEEMKDKYLNMYPWDENGKYWGDRHYELTHSVKNYEVTVRGWRIECLDKTLIKEQVETQKAELEAEEAREMAEQKKKNTEYARECGKVAKKLKVSFVNVLRLGYQDEEKILEFQNTLENAKKVLSRMSKREKEDLYHELYECGRARKSKALDVLGIDTMGADPNKLDFSELEKCF